MSALPKEVRRKIKQAEKAHEQAYGTPPATPPVEDIPPVKVVDDTTPDATAVVDATPQVDTPVAEPELTPPEGGTETAAPPTEAEKWEHKYNVLNGKYKAEVPRLQKQIKDLGGQVNQLQAVLSTLEKAKPAEAAVTPAPEAATKLLKDEEITDYGEDMISVVKRAAREELAPEMQRLQNENAELKAQMGTVVETSATTARQSVYDSLDEQVSNWRELNSEEGFGVWLDTLDAYTNRMRRELLNDAFETNDAARVIVFFKDYLKEKAVVSPPPEETPATTVTTPQVDMASLAAPGKPRGGAAPGTQEGQQTWRQPEIAAFYNDVRKGKYRSNPDEKARLEKSIMNAVASNRIVA